MFNRYIGMNKMKNPKTFMSRVFLLLAASATLLLNSCSTFTNLTHPGNKYQYHYTMISPVQDDHMLYRDSTIYVQFRFDDAAIKFQLQNISSGPIEIVWPRAEIGIRNKFSAVRDSKSMYNANPTCTATVLPSLAYAVDFAIPEKNIYYDGEWKERDLLPTTDKGTGESRDRIMSLVGTPLSFVLPIKSGDNVTDYTFTFAVTAVDQIGWEHYKPPARPLPPAKEKLITPASQYWTGAIIALIVTSAAILLTQKKQQPSP
jgi:hypothetical protein